MRLTVLIADDDPASRRVLVELFRDQPDLEVAGEARDAAEAADLAERLKPDLALLDVRMPGGGGSVAAREIAGRSPGTRIVAYSGHEDAEHVREMLRAGAVAYAVKNGSPTELFATIRAAGSRPPRIPRSVAERSEASEIAATRVLIHHPDPVILEAIADAVDRLAVAEVVGLAQTESHALSLAARHRPSVALIPATNEGSGLTRDLRAAHPGVRTVALSVFRDRRTAALGDAWHCQVHPEALAQLELILLLGNTDDTADPMVMTMPLVPATEDPPEARVRALLRAPLPMALQPIVRIAPSGDVGSSVEVAGYEALARFPDGRTPDVVFAEANRCGLGLELELHALEGALAQLDRVEPGAFLSVNIGPDALLHPGFETRLEDAPPERVVFELTEHAPVRDYDALTLRLEQLRARGFRVAVDDCGAGFASLRHVVLVDPEFLKLDVVLCRGVREPIRWAMARALAGFASETGAIAVAEGVEDPEDLAALAELGVPMGQGHLLGEPALPATAVGA